MQTAENDVLRDEAEARKLEEASVRVTSVRCNGMILDWGLLNPIQLSARARPCSKPPPN